MTNILKPALFAFLILCFGAASAAAQKTPVKKTPVSKTPDYKISNLKITPFDSFKGEFQEEIKPGSDISFFNDYSTSFLVVVEISIEKGGLEFNRLVQITATEGKKTKKTASVRMVPFEDNDKYYVPFWLDAGICDTLTITAKMTGQKTPATVTRKIPFQCGE